MARPAPPALAFQDDQAFETPGAVRDRLVQQMLRQGSRDVRLNVFYGKVKQGGYGQLDETVNYLRSRGINAQMTIIPTPRYMQGAPSELSYKNTNPALMGLFAKEVAGHFKGRVKRYSVGNEPNYSGFNYGANTDPVRAGRAYRAQYQAGYAGIKSVDPGAAVMLGEMTSTPNAKKFLQAVLAGKPLKTSGFAYHPYETAGGNKGTWDINNLRDLQATLAAYKRRGQLQTATGQAAPLYLTEFGDHLHQQPGTSAAQRLRFLEMAYARAREAGARQLLQYQVVPTVRTDPTKWVWDTSIGDAAGDIPVVNRGLRLARPVRRARAAKAKGKRKK